MPATEHTGEFGCYLVATETLGALPATDLYWHIYEYPARAAAESAKPASSGTVVESLDKTWLYVIGKKDWQPSAGQRVAVIGPLHVNGDARARYTARYMEATFPPGMQTSAHTHSGPEAWYILSGIQCLQTPDGQSITRAGQGAVVPMGPPMVLTSLGNEIRRSIVLVLHDSSQPWMSIVTEWKPGTTCKPEQGD